MDTLKKSIIESYTQFLTQKNKESVGIRGDGIFSFICPIKEINLTNLLEQLSKSDQRVLFYEKPEEKFAFLAIGEAKGIQESGEGRFLSTCKKVKENRNVFINNWITIPHRIIPLYVGGMKFNVEHSDEVWKEFNDSSWILPELLFCEIGDESYLVYNITATPPVPISKTSNRLRKLLDNYLLENVVKESYRLPVISDLRGNSPKEKKKWKLLVGEAKELIEEKKLEKVVLARRVEAVLIEQVGLNDLALYFRERFPGCYNFIYKPEKSIFFGATPELLIRFKSGRIEIDALAGSFPRGNDSQQDKLFENELLKSEKDQTEHKIVVDYIVNALAGGVENIKVGETSVKKLNNIQHLMTKIEGDLPFDIQIFNILKELHPTPAVCGMPKDGSATFIKKKEIHQRGLYSGIIGWFNYNFEGEFIVAIRSGLLNGKKMYAFAGSGIVKDSDPETEWVETELKLSPILSIFRNEEKTKS